MNVPYLLRLACLSLASFFLVNAFAGLTVCLASSAAMRIAKKMRPRSAARFLYFLRVLPVILGMTAVLGLCVPSYLWLEPQSASESIGFACVMLTLLGVAAWSRSLARAARAIGASARLSREWRQTGSETSLTGQESPAVVVERNAPLLALGGVFRPQLVVSSGVLRVLSNEQLELALEHEKAHRDSRDNLKRLFLLLTPEFLPFVKGFTPLEQGCAKFSEWAADDEAVRGDPRRALSLAAALLRVARLGAGPRLSFLQSSLLPWDQDLSARVDRLLRVEPLPAAQTARRPRAIVGVLSCVVFVLTAANMPAALSSVHRLLELFLR